MTDTLEFGEQCVKPGLNLMTGPGNDSVSITDLLASGVQLLLFTTGRGNPLGTAIPTIKLASNTSLYERKNAWIDFNAGIVLESIPSLRHRRSCGKLVIDVASGKVRTKSEKSGYKGNYDF